MVVTLKTLVESFDPLKSLASNKFKATVAFELAALIKNIRQHVEVYEETRNECAKKYSSNDQSVDQENIPVFIKELNELLDKEVEIPDFTLSKADVENFELIPLHLAVLNEWLIK